jgi:branched-chain amino acid transport system ATP-binding protein
MGISDHLVVMNYGKKIAEGAPDQVRVNPEVVTAYIGAR